MPRTLLTLLCLLALPGAAAQPPAAPPAEAEPPSLAAQLQPFVHPVEIHDGKIRGAGADLLVERARRARFFLVGEQHGAGGVARMITALYRTVEPLGYDVAAVETGPWTARRLEALLSDDDPGALARFFAEAPHVFVVPFYSWTEEAELARAVVELHDAPGPDLWGLDQVFVAGGPILVARLAELAVTDAQRALVARLRAELDGNPMLVGSAPPETVAELGATFADAGEEARAIVDALTVSHRIYGPFVRREGSVYLANREREELMKTTFLGHYRAAAAPPRVFVKLGANHLVRGVSPTRVQSLGSFLSALATIEGTTAYHLHVDCRGGQVRTPQGAAAPCQSYYLADGGALLDAVPAGTAAVVDLEALRSEPGILRQLDDASRDLVDAYDAYLAVPDPEPATFFEGKLPALP